MEKMEGEPMTIPETILSQLGGKRFIAMTGARNFTADGERKLMFSIPRRMAKNGIVKVTINLDWCDTYTIKFYRFDGFNVVLVAEYNDVYFDQLQDLFTQETGLYTTI
jgi:hypothetical protein